MLRKYGHILPLVVILGGFIYIMYVNIIMASKQISIPHGTTDHSFYFTSVEITPEIKAQAKRLQSIQATLDYVTNIPYKVHNFNARKPMDTIQRNYGDCDDKSNLLSSLLTAKGYENYIVLVPKHAFVIVNSKEVHPDKKALYFQNKRFYILESTAKNSLIGYAFNYKINEIEAIIDPIQKNILKTGKITYY